MRGAWPQAFAVVSPALKSVTAAAKWKNTSKNNLPMACHGLFAIASLG
jgi:hypothetical protein